MPSVAAKPAPVAAAPVAVEGRSDLRAIRNALRGLLGLALVAALYFARDFLLPVVFAVFIAITFRPMVRALSRRGVPAWATTGAIVVLFAGLLVAAAYVFSGAIAEWAANAEQTQRKFLERIDALRASISDLTSLTEQLHDAASPTVDPDVQEVVVREPLLPTMVSFAAAYPASMFLVIGGAVVTAVFLMGSGDLFYEKLIRVMPRLSDKKNALRIVLDVETQVSTYLVSLTAINAGLAVLVGLAFWALGMPTPHLWALLAFILNFIPYVGPIAGMLLASAIAIVVFDSPGQALLAPAAYMLLIGLETQIVTPAVLSQRMRINAVTILLALAFFAWLWGIAGIVLAVPALVTFRVLCSHIAALAPAGEFLSHRNNGQANEAGP